MSTASLTPEAKRVLAQDARRKRAARIGQMRRRAVATAVATLALAVGAVAYDGSMDETAATTATAATAATAVAQDTTTSDDDVVTTRQS